MNASPHQLVWHEQCRTFMQVIVLAEAAFLKKLPFCTLTSQLGDRKPNKTQGRDLEPPKVSPDLKDALILMKTVKWNTAIEREQLTTEAEKFPLLSSDPIVL